MEQRGALHVLLGITNGFFGLSAAPFAAAPPPTFEAGDAAEEEAEAGEEAAAGAPGQERSRWRTSCSSGSWFRRKEID